MLINILFLLCCIKKHRHIQNVRIWCFERNTVWLKEGLILVWKEDCTSSEEKNITACLEECSILCRGTVSWTKSYFVWKENCSLWMKLPFVKHGKERCNLKQIASFKKCCALWPEYVLIFFESNSFVFAKGSQQILPLWHQQKAENGRFLGGCSYMVPPPKDLQFWPTFLKSCGLGWYMSAIPSNPCSPTTPIANSQKRRFFWGASIYIYIYKYTHIPSTSWLVLLQRLSRYIYIYI